MKRLNMYITEYNSPIVLKKDDLKLIASFFGELGEDKAIDIMKKKLDKPELEHFEEIINNLMIYLTQD